MGKKTKAEKKVHKVMKEYKNKKLNVGKSKKKVKSRQQAIAIALNMAGLTRDSNRSSNKRNSTKSKRTNNKRTNTTRS